MNVASPATGRPGRSLLVLAVIMIALGGWMFISGNTSPQLGLDLQGGTSITLEPEVAPGEEGQITDESIDQAVNIIQQRVDGSGVVEASVSAQGSGDSAVIVVSVPGTAEGKLVEQLGQTASLAFRPVLATAPGTNVPQPAPSPEPSKTDKQGGGGNGGGNDGNNPQGNPGETAANPAVLPRLADGDGTGGNNNGGNQTAEPTPSPTPSTPDTGQTDAPITRPEQVDPKLQQQFQELDCAEDPRIGDDFNSGEAAIACDELGAFKYLLAPVAVEGANVDNAAAQIPAQGLGWVVTLDFDGDGTAAFGTTSTALAANIGEPPRDQFAIVLDGLVISAPGINEPILGGQAEISGDFTQQEATDLANVLKYGALPLSFTTAELQTVSPTLGEDQLQAGLIAGALGLVLVVVYLLLYYRALALVAVLSLVVAGLLVYGCVVLLGETLGFSLTLAGVAGLIVAIGITADSFIVYFERIRDEVREGRTMRVALEAGWTRAKRTIIAADFISLIAAVVLYVLSVGNVRGFAFTLGLTTVIDLLVVFLFTKPVVSILAKTKFFQSGSKWSGLSPERLGAKRAVGTKSTVASRRRAETEGA